MLGIYIFSDDNTSKGNKMDVARLMIRARCAMVINEVINIKVNENMFRIKMIEEAQGLVGDLGRKNNYGVLGSVSVESESKRSYDGSEEDDNDGIF